MDIQQNVSLARYSTLHVGGQARAFTRVTTLDELKAALTWAEEHGLPWFVLGGGANFFCRDEGFPGLVIKMENRHLDITGREVTAEAGVVTRVMVLKAVAAGLRDIEHLAGIPGTVGGAVRGNAGAFGTETKDTIARVRLLWRSARGWEERVLPRPLLQFAYRDSTFKRGAGTYVIWSATFSLPTGDREEGERRVAEDLAARKAKQPYEFPSVGSIFLNPSADQSAGLLIEQAGLKGFRVGGAEVSTKHANFIVNRGGASAEDVLTLLRHVQRQVRNTSGIDLETEIVIL